MLDLTTDFGKRAAERLAKEKVIWLTTVGVDGAPQPNPVWFVWESDYREGIPAIGMTPESFAQSYSVAIRVTPNKMRGF
jgi:hypothetical protein